MRQPSAATSELARRILSIEAAGSREPEALTAAVDRACDKLKGELENLVGPGGSAALIGRARTLATRSPAGSRTSVESEGVAILAHLLALLISLLGEELALNPVRKIWPDDVVGESATGSPETEG